MRRKATIQPPHAPPGDATDAGRTLRTSRSLGGHMHRQMRGRYRWLALAALGGLVIGAALGFLSTEPIYRTVALVFAEHVGRTVGGLPPGETGGNGKEVTP